jgi:hypothetical protein
MEHVWCSFGFEPSPPTVLYHYTMSEWWVQRWKFELRRSTSHLRKLSQLPNCSVHRIHANDKCLYIPPMGVDTWLKVWIIAIQSCSTSYLSQEVSAWLPWQWRAFTSKAWAPGRCAVISTLWLPRSRKHLWWVNVLDSDLGSCWEFSKSITSTPHGWQWSSLSLKLLAITIILVHKYRSIIPLPAGARFYTFADMMRLISSFLHQPYILYYLQVHAEDASRIGGSIYRHDCQFLLLNTVWIPWILYSFRTVAICVYSENFPSDGLCIGNCTLMNSSVQRVVHWCFWRCI